MSVGLSASASSFNCAIWKNHEKFYTAKPPNSSLFMLVFLFVLCSVKALIQSVGWLILFQINSLRISDKNRLKICNSPHQTCEFEMAG